MTWLVLALVSAFCLGIYDVSKKAALEDNAVLPVLLASTLVGLVLLAPVVLMTATSPYLSQHVGLYVEPLSRAQHPLVFGKAALVTASWVCNFFALKHLPISLAAPLRATAPLFTLAGAVVLFGERLTGAQWVAVLSILAAYWAFSLVGRLEGIQFSRNRWVWLLALGTLLGAASGLYDKHLLQAERIPPWSLQVWFTAYGALLQLALVLTVWWPRRRQTTPFRPRLWIVGVGAFLLLADFAYFRALAEPGALVSVVSVVRRSNVVVSFTLGVILFREERPWAKAGALVGVLAGLSLLIR